MNSLRKAFVLTVLTLLLAPAAALATHNASHTTGGTGAGGAGQTTGGTGEGAGGQTTGGVGAGTGGQTTGGVGAGDADGIRLVNPLKVDSIEELLLLILDAAIRIGTIVLILALIWVGVLFVAARGNEEKLRTAKAAFFWTIIGGLILLGARGIAEVIQATATSLGSS